MKRRDLILGAAAVTGLVAVDNVLAQPLVVPATMLPPVDDKVARAGFIQAGIVEIYQAPIRVDGKLAGLNPVVILKARDEERYMNIYIGATESHSITMGLEDSQTPRPMSHELMVGLVEALKGRVAAVYIQEGAMKGILYALVRVVGEGIDTEVDSRPSDAFALALRAKAPVLVAEKLVKEATLEAARPT